MVLSLPLCVCVCIYCTVTVPRPDSTRGKCWDGNLCVPFFPVPPKVAEVKDHQTKKGCVENDRLNNRHRVVWLFVLCLPSDFLSAVFIRLLVLLCCFFFSFLRFCFPSLLSRAYLCCVLFLMSFVFLCSFICLSFTSGFPSGVFVLSAIGRCNYPRVRRDADGTFPGLYRLIEVLFRRRRQKKNRNDSWCDFRVVQIDKWKKYSY